MRASLRGKRMLLVGLLLAPSAALAQSAPDPAPGAAPATNAVGPQELQNFSLPGNVTKPADQPATPAPAASPSSSSSTGTSADAPRTTAATGRRAAPPREQARAIAAVRPQSVPQAPPSASAPAPALLAGSAPPLTSAPIPAFAPTFAQPAAPASGPAFATAPATAAPPVPEHRLLMWPWLLAALALAGGTLFLLWRRRPRQAFAGGAEFDLFVPPEPPPEPPRPPRAASPPRAAPTPQPAPAPPTPPAPSSGIVSTRLRPALEIGVQPLRCVVEDERVVLEFEVELFNSGTAPARAVLAEASLFNAGAGQEQELARFFANPIGEGERLEAIAPMKRMTFVNQVVAPRAAIQEYELAGRKVFVPLLAFNALYLWTGGQAQTSAAYLVGRDTGSDKLGPLSLDGGPRQIGKLAARSLPTAFRS